MRNGKDVKCSADHVVGETASRPHARTRPPKHYAVVLGGLLLKYNFSEVHPIFYYMNCRNINGYPGCNARYSVLNSVSFVYSKDHLYSERVAR